MSTVEMTDNPETATQVWVTAVFTVEPGAAEDEAERVSRLLTGAGAHAVKTTIAFANTTELTPDLDLQARLSTPLPEAAWPVTPNASSRARVLGPLNQAGIFTLRDVLVVGKNRLNSVRNVGPKHLSVLTEIIRSNTGDPSVSLKGHPDVTDDVARFCTSLDQVPGLAVDSRFAGYNLAKLANMSVADVLSKFVAPSYSGVRVWPVIPTVEADDRLANNLFQAIQDYVTALKTGWAKLRTD